SKRHWDKVVVPFCSVQAELYGGCIKSRLAVTNLFVKYCLVYAENRFATTNCGKYLAVGLLIQPQHTAR
ncbi:hypothetical protein JXB12_08105, partial [candidate division KSB1 bacterium]|nr:hypothetical protein [candidate division KSB1 bacterium]